ncbi:pumilio like proteiny domain family member 6 [Angomonas deanei]|uniref:Uncharacterized protein n=1 Tax=Angomonas deanei TaxID=59799 RepID=A0A7G2CFG5_9TRYP|nr:pumilio like proteiny domain family member 6 [Angomonas deanei]CAD2217433.1 hypothetical protein, conserved [Angomonas deanei]|eukprot:EPY22157.1 pumilio like proteiny domain family member 6 [Angomonas deanei]
MKWVSKDFSCYASDAYAHFVVMSIVRHAPHDVFKTLLASLIPNVSHLISHKFGIVTLHAAYSSKWCGKLDCQLLLLSVLKENVSVMKRWEGYPVLEDVLQKNPTLQKRLLPRLFDLCDKLVSQKEAIQFPFVQKLVYAYVKCGTREEVSELCETLRPYLASISTTREGAPLASLAFSLTEPKRRKEILQNFKDNLGEISTNKYGAPVIARLFDLLYDAQMLQKYVVADMTAHIGQVFSSPYGYLILMHLLTPHKERKDKFLLQNWHEHNLFSVENKEWNHHTWLTADYQTEVIEICSKPAQASHLLCLPAVVKSVIQYLKTTENKEKINRHQAFLVCREILHVEETEPMYRAAFSLTEADREVLRGFVGTKAAAEEEASTKKSPRKVEKKEKTTKKRARPADESAPKKDKSTKKVKKSQ